VINLGRAHSYAVKDLTLQGEGALTGRPAVFCRLPGAFVVGARDPTARPRPARFATPIFVGTMGPGGHPGRRDARRPGRRAAATPGTQSGPVRFVVCTGGNRSYSWTELIEAFPARFAVAIGITAHFRHGLDWVCVSPQAGAPIVVTAGDGR
jgi:hypothetical protein